MKAARVLMMMVTFLWMVKAVMVEAGDGKAIFDAKKCGDCHLTAGPNTDKTFADKLKRKGTDLWFAGSKYKKEWLVEWMKNPVTIRPMEYNSIEKKNPGNHPKLSAEESRDVADYLMALKSKDVAGGVIQEGMGGIQGKIVFEKKQGCFGCHQIKKAGKVTGGLTGPSLAEAGKRLNGDWIYAYLKDPKPLIPVKRMPIYAGILTDADMKAVAGYLTTLK
ncbi:MAG: c-type cytochrome [Deltaproteobacteria bacterium]|nr:c-type cytochrome [Deltaproteobacteria bacterium]